MALGLLLCHGPSLPCIARPVWAVMRQKGLYVFRWKCALTITTDIAHRVDHLSARAVPLTGRRSPLSAAAHLVFVN